MYIPNDFTDNILTDDDYTQAWGLTKNEVLFFMDDFEDSREDYCESDSWGCITDTTN